MEVKLWKMHSKLNNPNESNLDPTHIFEKISSKANDGLVLHLEEFTPGLECAVWIRISLLVPSFSCFYYCSSWILSWYLHHCHDSDFPDLCLIGSCCILYAGEKWGECVCGLCQKMMQNARVLSLT